MEFSGDKSRIVEWGEYSRGNFVTETQLACTRAL